MSLTQEGIGRALQVLDDEYPEEPKLTQLQKDLWRDVLSKLRPGELRPALQHFGARRPGPLDLLSIVQKYRDTGQRPPRASMPPIARQVIDKARKDLAHG